jgi:glycosyltransferase involved in cell wall biosynthesis
MSIMTAGRVAFDVTAARTNRMGTGVYTRKLVESLQPLMGDRLAPIECGFARTLRHRKTVSDRVATLAHDTWWTQVGTLNAARACRANLLHVPAMLAPLRSSLPVVVTIHDLAIVRFPQMFRRWHRTFSTYLLPRVVQTVNQIVTVSEATKADLVELLGVAPDRVSVIPCGISSDFAPLPHGDPCLDDVRRRYSLPENYAITVGAIEPRKNLPRLLRALKLLATRRPEFKNLTLCHVGPAGWLTEDVSRTIAELGLHDRVRFLGFVPNDDLAALYQPARVSLYPSLFEGFGLPIVEAMASGCPVVTSNCSSMPEVAGGAAVLVDPMSEESIADGLARVWLDDRMRCDMIARGRCRAAVFTWEAAARETVTLYDRVLAAA